jgi:O-antigen ligase
MIDSRLALETKAASRQHYSSLAAALGVSTSAILFYLVAATRLNHDMVAIAAVWVVLLASLKDYRYLIIGWFLVSPYFPFGIKGHLNLSLNLSHNLFVPFIASVALVARMRHGRRLEWGRLDWGREDVFFLGFVIYAVFSSLYTWGGRYQDFKAIYAIYVLPFLLYTAIKNLTIDRHFLSVLAYACLFHVIILSLIGYVEYRTGLSLYTQVLLWRDVGLGRIAGPFGSPIILGLCVSFLSLQLYLGYKLGAIPRLLFGFSVVLSAMLFVLTFTRSVWLGVVASTVYLILKGQPKPATRALQLVGFLVVVSVVVSYMLSDPVLGARLAGSTNVKFRIVMGYASLKMIAANPLLGSGFGSFDDLVPKYVPIMLGVRIVRDTSHVTLLTFMAELGAAGTFLLLAFMVTAFYGSGRRTQRSACDQHHLIRLVNTAFILAFAVNAFLIDMRFFSLAYSWLFISLGMIHNVRRAEESRPNGIASGG